MISLKRILLPSDFSEYSEVAIDYACALAEQFDAELHLFHVLDVYIDPTPQFGMGLAIPTQIEESQEAANKALHDVVDAAWEKDHRVVRATAQGSPFLEIIRYATKQDIDVIVMATHGRSGLAHVLMGSVSERVVRQAPCPVLTVRPKGHQFVLP